jgi:phosphate acyltransferase
MRPGAILYLFYYPDMIKIALDAMGGDFAPKSIIEGAVMAAAEIPAGVTIVLIGKEDVIQQHLADLKVPEGTFEVVHAEEVIQMGEHPTKALTQKQRSSIVIGFELLKRGHVSAFSSAGNTGAMLVGSMFSVKATEGILRPAIAGFLPKENGGEGVLLDVGANADCKPEVLAQFGVMGSLYAKHVLGIDNPKVGLMNVGEEEGKGDVASQAAYQLLKNNTKINFIGNIEGRDLFNDKADVVVCDGFTGNVILKMAEEVYEMLEARKIHDPFFDRINYESVGGSPIIGVNGSVMIGHGVSSPLAIKNMLLKSLQMAQADVHLKISKALSA